MTIGFNIQTGEALILEGVSSGGGATPIQLVYAGVNFSDIKWGNVIETKTTTVSGWTDTYFDTQIALNKGKWIVECAVLFTDTRSSGNAGACQCAFNDGTGKNIAIFQHTCNAGQNRFLSASGMIELKDGDNTNFKVCVSHEFGGKQELLKFSAMKVGN